MTKSTTTNKIGIVVNPSPIVKQGKSETGGGFIAPRVVSQGTNETGGGFTPPRVVKLG